MVVKGSLAVFYYVDLIWPEADAEAVFAKFYEIAEPLPLDTVKEDENFEIEKE